ncbi:MAG: DUF5074 domain-containing protein [Bacteroidota bacterium]
MTKNLNFLLLLTLLIFSSCSNDDDFVNIEPRGDYDFGLLISHEGNFGQGNASVAWVSNDLQTVEKNIFNTVNGTPLGDTAQSMAFSDDLAYIVLNASNKIEVVNRFTFESVATINSGLSNPRYMVISNGKAYVTNWGDFTPDDDDYVAVIDLTTNAVVDTIPTSYLPEELVAFGNKLYVVTGIFGFGNQVDVINTTTDQSEGSITVGNSPNSLQIDDANNLWVLSSENLIKINTTTDEILDTIDFPDTISSASDLNHDLGNLYFYADNSVYRTSVNSDTFPTNTIIDNVNFYDMRVSNDFLFGLDALDFQSDGTLSVYNLTSNVETATLTLDIIPGEIYFN